MKNTPQHANHRRIVVFNDQQTPYAFVHDLLQTVFGKSDFEAKILANTAHYYGQCFCGPYPLGVADALIAAARAAIAEANHTLGIELEDTKGEIDTARCSLCGNIESQVKFLYPGNRGAICDVCIVKGAAHLQAGFTQQRFKHAYELLNWHFAGLAREEIVASARLFPGRMRADLQVAIDKLLATDTIKLVGIHSDRTHEAITISDLIQDDRYAKLIAPLQYEDVDIGTDTPIRGLNNGLWLRVESGLRHAVLLSHYRDYQGNASIHVEIAVPAGEAGQQFTQRYFRELEQAVNAAQSYRGKVLSLEQAHEYSGMSKGIAVHRLAPVARDEIVLPEKTLALLDRNVLEFAATRDALRSYGQSTKKGLLFYGPPGTGKTHTVRYLAANLPGHTTLLITAEQVALLPEYFALARLLQPALVVIEDADLIARSRNSMNSACEEATLNQLLNEMDGLKDEADIFFILTTNRPETLEAALAARPGRIDQAIEFPLPDDDGRRKLMALYSGQLKLRKPVQTEMVRQTQGVSAAFIKELMRRIAQNVISSGKDEVDTAQVNAALEEMLFAGGKLNAQLLGGAKNQ